MFILLLKYNGQVVQSYQSIGLALKNIMTNEIHISNIKTKIILIFNII